MISIYNYFCIFYSEWVKYSNTHVKSHQIIQNDSIYFLCIVLLCAMREKSIIIMCNCVAIMYCICSD